MATGITARLSALRKEKGISQKEAAAGLGVSQALLSHYENGIRECGLDFLCRAADYYNVTTDYLLGISESKRGFEGAFGINDDIYSDAELSTLTIFRVAGKLRKFLTFRQENSGTSSDVMHMIYCLIMYRLIIAESAKGTLPCEWVPNAEVLNDRNYLNIIDRVANELITAGSNASRQIPNKIPLSFKTVIEQAQSIINSRCEKSGIKLGDIYTTEF